MLATTIISGKAYQVRGNGLNVTVLAKTSSDAIIYGTDIVFKEIENARRKCIASNEHRAFDRNIALDK